MKILTIVTIFDDFGPKTPISPKKLPKNREKKGCRKKGVNGASLNTLGPLKNLGAARYTFAYIPLLTPE